MAIKSALMSGLEADPRCRNGALAWLDLASTRTKSVEDIKDLIDDYDQSVGNKTEESTAVYHPTEPPPGWKQKDSATPVEGVCRIFLGYARSHPLCVGAANYLKKHLPTPAWPEKQDRQYMYYFYYGTLLMHQMGGDFWSSWNTALKPALTGAQIKAPDSNAGAFPAAGIDCEVGGEVYSTAMCVLTLETYYRYLPMLWFR
jgi:hypothetical protein